MLRARGPHPRPVPIATVVAVVTVMFAGLVAAPAAAASGFSITPTAGPPGTMITITGTVPVAERAQYLTPPSRLWLQLNVNGGTFQLFDDGTVTVDPAGNLVATFHVPETGDYIQGKPDALFHPAIPGTYTVSFPCHACSLGLTFTVTTTSAPPMAVTGQRDGTLTAIAVLLLVVGAGAMYLGRRRTS